MTETQGTIPHTGIIKKDQGDTMTIENIRVRGEEESMKGQEKSEEETRRRLRSRGLENIMRGMIERGQGIIREETMRDSQDLITSRHSILTGRITMRTKEDINLNFQHYFLLFSSRFTSFNPGNLLNNNWHSRFLSYFYFFFSCFMTFFLDL